MIYNSIKNKIIVVMHFSEVSKVMLYLVFRDTLL